MMWSKLNVIRISWSTLDSACDRLLNQIEIEFKFALPHCCLYRKQFLLCIELSSSWFESNDFILISFHFPYHHPNYLTEEKFQCSPLNLLQMKTNQDANTERNSLTMMYYVIYARFHRFFFHFSFINLIILWIIQSVD